MKTKTEEKKPAAKPASQKTENQPALLERGEVPEWFFLDDPETYDVAGPSAGSGGALPWVSTAHARAGASGGSTTWTGLQAAGCAEGDAYAAGGGFESPRRLAGVPLLLLKCIRVAYVDGEGFRPEGLRRIKDRGEASPEERQAVDALFLVLDDRPFLATYRERLHPALQYHSTVVGPWADRLAKEDGGGGLPRWARLAGKLRSEPKTSKKTGNAYRVDRLTTGPLTAPEVERLVAWSRGPGLASAADVTAWESRYEAPAATAPSPRDDEAPF